MIESGFESSPSDADLAGSHYTMAHGHPGILTDAGKGFWHHAFYICTMLCYAHNHKAEFAFTVFLLSMLGIEPRASQAPYLCASAQGKLKDGVHSLFVGASDAPS